MSNIVCCTSQSSVGCTFLDWSINYLAGKTQYLHSTKGWIDLVENPIANNNAHRHKKNHPSGLAESQECVKFLKTHSEFATFYPIAQHLDVAAQQHNICLENISPKDQAFLTQQVVNDYNKMLHWLYESDVKIIFVSLSKTLPLYLTTLRSTDRLLHTGKPGSAADVRQGIDKIFFQKSTKHWSELELTNSWDIRERLALDLRPFEYHPWDVDLSMPHLWVDSQELWYNGKSKIKEIMHWLNVAVDPQRLDSWNKVFDQWQQIQLSNLKFQYIYQHIIDSIINNWCYSIDLTFEQEVVIQHCLIYHHNLNLKTWQLEKFPDNTKDLHLLLEPNIHPVSKIYD